MSVEVATYINELNASNPTATDRLSFGADHLRLIKAVLKATFPNASTPITATHTDLNAFAGITANVSELNIMSGATITTAELNYADGTTSAVQTQLDAKVNNLPVEIVTNTSFTATVNKFTVRRAASSGTVTLPSSPSVGDRVVICNANSGTLGIAAGARVNGSTSARPSAIGASATATFIYLDSTTGWSFDTG